MRIAIIAPLAESIPPKKYGGTERVVYHLVNGLIDRGHSVTLFASGDSKTKAKLISVVSRSLRRMAGEGNIQAKDIYGFNTYTMLNLGIAYDMQDQFDIIHDHEPHMSLPTAQQSKTPVVVTWHGPYTPEMTALFWRLNKPHVTSISKAQASTAPGINLLGTVHNGIVTKDYPFGGKPEDYLLYVGRIDIEKGAHIAIDVAVALKKKLIMAAKADVQVPAIKDYFDREIAPRLEKHRNLVTWVGEVNEAQRNELMKNATCLLHPITWPEPFGLTLIEAMACGCPVVAFNLGSMQEVINHGKTGFVVENFDEMLKAVKIIGTINRMDCREYALTNFSPDRMVEGYLNLYQKAIELNKSGAKILEPKFKHRFLSQFSDVHN